MSKDISLMIDDVKFNFRVGCIMVYENYVILEKGLKAKYYVIPGGRVKTLEDTKLALLRELEEEMHIDFKNKDIKLHHIIENFFTIDGIKYHEPYFIYKMKLDDSDEIVKRRKEKLINYDSQGNWYEFIDIQKLDGVNILPVELKKIITSDNFSTTIVRD